MRNIGARASLTTHAVESKIVDLEQAPYGNAFCLTRIVLQEAMAQSIDNPQNAIQSKNFRIERPPGRPSPPWDRKEFPCAG